MQSYGSILKKLIKFTNVKLSIVADAAGYDVSYISKWCNQSKLPAARVASPINKSLSKIFADEIISQGELENFCSEFNVAVSEDQLQVYLYTILKDSFKSTQAYYDKKSSKNGDYQTKVLLDPAEIASYMDTEFKNIITSSEGSVEILCTLDVCSLPKAQSTLSVDNDTVPEVNIKVKMGLNPHHLNNDTYLFLYYFIKMCIRDSTYILCC